jgi:hypothetical protein
LVLAAFEKLLKPLPLLLHAIHIQLARAARIVNALHDVKDQHKHSHGTAAWLSRNTEWDTKKRKVLKNERKYI